MKKINPISIKHAEERFVALKKLSTFTQIRTGWIEYIRHILGMTLKDVAKKTNLAVSTVAQMEKREESGNITVQSLKKVAEALQCDFIYAFVPRNKISKTIDRQAFIKALDTLLRANTHMQLEDQGVQGDVHQRAKDLAELLKDKGDIW